MSGRSIAHSQHPQRGNKVTRPDSHRKENQYMYRSCLSGLAASMVALISVTQAPGQQLCRPALTVKDVQFSQMQAPTWERTWTAIVAVDASRCTVNSTGSFEIVFSRQKENGVEIEFSEKFTWSPPTVRVAVDFWADEAVERYWISNVSACVCAR
jgi:hypothetical protein